MHQHIDDSSWSVRPMAEDDLDEVMAIEINSFKSPWSRVSFLNDLRRSDAISLVGDCDHHVIAYLVAWQVKDEVHIGNLAVHSDWRRRGLAQDMIRQLFIHRSYLRWAWLEVRKSNKTARRLYSKLGFKEISVRKNYYEAEHEDAIVMAKDLLQD
ncbi:ribosomal protein S18-alanine N-acetyltransferase [bacterium]|nr:ribosomal protein S18-alanine N-acetyltransferase [bacterium]